MTNSTPFLPLRLAALRSSRRRFSSTSPLFRRTYLVGMPQQIRIAAHRAGPPNGPGSLLFRISHLTTCVKTIPKTYKKGGLPPYVILYLVVVALVATSVYAASTSSREVALLLLAASGLVHTLFDKPRALCGRARWGGCKVVLALRAALRNFS